MKRLNEKMEPKATNYKVVLAALAMVLILIGLVFGPRFFSESIKKHRIPTPQKKETAEKLTPTTKVEPKAETVPAVAPLIEPSTVVKKTVVVKSKKAKPKPATVRRPVRRPIPEIKPITLTFNGQEWEQILPSKDRAFKLWTNYGANPFGKRDPKIFVSKSMLPDDIKEDFISNLRMAQGSGFDELTKDENTGFRWHSIDRGNYSNQMAFGKGKIWNDVIADGPEGKMEAAKMYLKEYNGFLYAVTGPLKCQNWSWLVLKPRPKEEVAKPPEFPPVPEYKGEEPKIPPVPIFKAEEPGFPPVPIFKGEEKSEAAIPQVPVAPSTQKRVVTKFEAMMGGGVYSKPGENSKGGYLWGKMRYRPLEFKFGEKTDGQLGFFLFGATGEGNEQEYNYRWKKFVFGPTLKVIGEGYDADLDVGVGRLYNQGGFSLYDSKQTDDIFLVSAHLNEYGRRLEGKKWFPKTEANVELTLPFRKRQEHSWDGRNLAPDAYNNTVLELTGTQWIYDYDLSDHWRASPGLTLGLGREWGSDLNFLQGGPAVQVSSYGQDVVQVNLFNYKHPLNGETGQWHWLSGWISLDGAYRAIKASRISAAP